MHRINRNFRGRETAKIHRQWENISSLENNWIYNKIILRITKRAWRSPKAKDKHYSFLKVRRTKINRSSPSINMIQISHHPTAPICKENFKQKWNCSGRIMKRNSDVVFEVAGNVHLIGISREIQEFKNIKIKKKGQMLGWMLDRRRYKEIY